jgi:predicted N-acetyltransferase YhbS
MAAIEYIILRLIRCYNQDLNVIIERENVIVGNVIVDALNLGSHEVAVGSESLRICAIN